MTLRKNTINMTEGPILKSIVLFAFPLLVANLLQLLYNAADLVVVSRFAGSHAMGAVGASASVTSMLVGSSIGISVGANVVVARCFGAKDKEGIQKAVHTSVALGGILGIIILVVALVFCKTILSLMDTPKEIFDGAVLYTRIFYLGVPGQLIYNFCAAVLRAMGDTKRPMYILGITGIVNVVLNLIFVICFNMDVAGVAIATITSQYLSAIAAFRLLLKEGQEFKVIPRQIRIYKKELIEILKIGIPNTISSSLISFSNLLVSSAVNSFGANATVGYAASTNIESFVYMGMNAISQASLTAVSQNYGAKNQKRLFKCMRRCIYLTAGIGIVLGGISAIFGKELLAIYITDNPKAIDFGYIRILITGIPYFVAGIMEIFSQTVRGLGYSTTATVNSIWTLVGLRIVWINFVLPNHHTPVVLFSCWVVSWILSIAAHSITIAIIKKKAMERMYAQ